MQSQQFCTLLVLSISTLVLNACGGGSTSAERLEDFTPPTITLKGANPLYIPLNTPFVDPGATAEDNQDGDISDQIDESNNIIENSAACYSQQYTSTDSSGNSRSVERTVFVGNDQERHAPNNLPVARDDSQSTFFTDSTIIDVLKNDTDKDCDELSVTSITQPSIGTARINSDNTVTFDPQGNIGSFFFEYTLSDNHGGTRVSGVTIASHDPNDGNDAWPEIREDAVSTTIGTPVFIDVLANDTDGDGDALVLDNADKPFHGTLIKDSGGFIYTPDPGYIGTDSFYYGVHDNHGHNGSAQVTITITQ